MGSIEKKWCSQSISGGLLFKDNRNPYLRLLMLIKTEKKFFPDNSLCSYAALMYKHLASKP
jgi:hypothetical protein